MIQFLVIKIFEKTKKIIEQFDEDAFLKKMFYGERYTPEEKTNFINRQFPDATEELFRGRRELKEQYVDALDDFLGAKYSQSGGSFEFVKKLLVPVRPKEGGEAAYSMETLSQWRNFSLNLAQKIKSPALIAVQMRDSSVEVISYRDLAEAKKDPKSKEILRTKAQTPEGKFLTERGEILTETETIAEMKARLKKKAETELKDAGFTEVEVAVTEEFGGLKTSGRGRDRYGKEFAFEANDLPAFQRTYSIYDPVKASFRAEVAGDKLSELFEKGGTAGAEIEMPIQTGKGAELERIPQIMKAKKELRDRRLKAGAGREPVTGGERLAGGGPQPPSPQQPPQQRPGAPQQFPAPPFAMETRAAPSKKKSKTKKKIIAAAAGAAGVFGSIGYFGLS